MITSTIIVNMCALVGIYFLPTSFQHNQTCSSRQTLIITYVCHRRGMLLFLLGFYTHAVMLLYFLFHISPLPMGSRLQIGDKWRGRHTHRNSGMAQLKTLSFGSCQTWQGDGYPCKYEITNKMFTTREYNKRRG